MQAFNSQTFSDTNTIIHIYVLTKGKNQMKEKNAPKIQKQISNNNNKKKNNNSKGQYNSNKTIEQTYGEH